MSEPAPIKKITHYRSHFISDARPNMKKFPITSVSRSFRKKIVHFQKVTDNVYRIKFKNGFGISVAFSHPINYCDSKGKSCEIMPLNQRMDSFPMPSWAEADNAHPCLKALGISSDQVKGHLDRKDLHEAMKIISNF